MVLPSRRPTFKPAVLLPVVLLILVLAFLAFDSRRGGGGEQDAASAGSPVAASPVAAPSGRAVAPTDARAGKPAGASAGPTAAAKPTSAALAKPATGLDVDRDRIVRGATWAPGQLDSHFDKHGREGPWASESVYDASARATIKEGTAFTYQDRESNAERLGFFDKAGNRFTAVTRDGRRITTHFRPDRGEAYVRGLSRSTYR